MLLFTSNLLEITNPYPSLIDPKQTRLCLVRETRDRSILRKPWKRVLEGRDSEEKKTVPITKGSMEGWEESRGMRVAVVGRKKWIMRRIENAGHDGNSAVLSRHPSRFPSPPRPLHSLCFLFSPVREGRNVKKKRKERSWYIARVCVCAEVLRRRFLMDYLFRALLSLYGIGPRIVHS